MTELELDVEVLVDEVDEEKVLPVVVVVIVVIELEGVIVTSGISIDDVVEIVHGHVVTVTIAVAVTVAVTL